MRITIITKVLLTLYLDDYDKLLLPVLAKGQGVAAGSRQDKIVGRLPSLWPPYLNVVWMLPGCCPSAAAWPPLKTCDTKISSCMHLNIFVSGVLGNNWDPVDRVTYNCVLGLPSPNNFALPGSCCHDLSLGKYWWQ